ncbi:polysaccharide pyruvyl transferase family protein [Vibrio sp. WJH972]
MKSLSFIAATFYGNRGAEGMLSTVLGKLKEDASEDIEFNVYSYYPDADRNLVSDESINIFSATPAYLVLVLVPCALLYRLFNLLLLKSALKILPSSILSLAESDALVCLAGVSFVEGRTKFILFNIATILPALIVGVPVVKLSQAMGPFNTQPNRLAAKIFLGACDQIFTRGDKTHSYLVDLLGDSKNYQRADDVAFHFKPRWSFSSPALDLSTKLKALDKAKQLGQVVVGVCPSIVISRNAAKAGWDYHSHMQELVSGLVENGYIVALYPNATRGKDMDKSHNNDLPLLRDIIDGFSDDLKQNVICFTDSYNAAQVHNIINACNVNAVSRFHAMVASLSSCVPVMVIGWSHKYLEVMERFEQQDMVLDYQIGNVEPIIKCINTLVEQSTQRIDQISERLPEVKNLSNKQFSYLCHI